MQPGIHTGETTASKIELAAIDASTRIPVLFFFSSAVFWLIVGTLFGALASFAMHIPGLLADFPWLHFGRIRPAHLNVVAYGWAALAGIGTALWLMARLCRTPLRFPGVLLAAGILWNIGMIVGVLGILGGDSTSVEWLEFPVYATPILFVAFAFVGVWTVMMFVFRKPGHVYVSQWFLLAAFFWFPWLYGTANLMVLIEPVQGVLQAVVNWWYGHNALGLWFTPIGLATAYYLIPKVVGKPIHSYHLSIIGFWSFAFFYSWNGMHHLIGGPLPAWLITASIVASVMMIIPVLTTAINHHMTMVGSFHVLKFSPTLRFTVFGAMSYTVVSLQGVLMSLRSFNEITHFTHYTVGHAHLGLYAFYTMILFGAIYYIMPRLVGWEWPSSKLIKLHFWSVALGILIMFGALTVGGFIQGLNLNNENIPFVEVMTQTKPWLITRSWSGILISIGHLAFLISFVMMILKLGKPKTEPTLLS